MCGRFALALSHRDILDNLEGEQIEEWIDQDHFHPRYNIAPRSYAPVIRRRRGGTNTNTPPSPSNDESGESSMVIHTMKWGLVPHWSKYEDTSLNTTNARSENLTGVGGGGMWGSIKAKNRCAVICQGYYEWLNRGRDKIPHFTKLRTPGRLMLLAGLYDRVVLKGETTPLWSFAIVTTDAAPEFGWLHDRQPVILSSKDALDTWLDTTTTLGWTEELSRLVGKPYQGVSCPLECYQVPKEIGKVGTESSTFIHPVNERKDGIQALFSKQQQQQQQQQQQHKHKHKHKKEEQFKEEKPPEHDDKPAEDDADVEENPGSNLSGKRKRSSSSIVDGNQESDESDIEILPGPPATTSQTKSTPKKKPVPVSPTTASPSSSPRKRTQQRQQKSTPPAPSDSMLKQEEQQQSHEEENPEQDSQPAKDDVEEKPGSNLSGKRKRSSSSVEKAGNDSEEESDSDIELLAGPPTTSQSKSTPKKKPVPVSPPTTAKKTFSSPSTSPRKRTKTASSADHSTKKITTFFHKRSTK